MASRRPRNSTFSVYVRFRKGRLPLKKGIRTIEEAREMLRALRAERFHDANQLFLVDEDTGVEIQAVRRFRRSRVARSERVPVAAARPRTDLPEPVPVTRQERLARLERSIMTARAASARYARAAAALKETMNEVPPVRSEGLHRLVEWTHVLHSLGERALEQLDGVVLTLSQARALQPAEYE